MPATLSTHATEEGTYVITITTKDENGDLVDPTTLMWTLTDLKGNVVNNREDVSISSPSSSEDVVLSGDDLQITDALGRDRMFVVEGTYSSDLGTGLPLKEWAYFSIDDSKAIS